MTTFVKVPQITRTRLGSIDILRGLVMVIMALDHTREFWGPTSFQPEDLSQTNGLLFFTRWVTHICAPTFVFLSGIGIYLYQEKVGRTKASVFALSRGAWLIVVEIVVMTFILTQGYNLIVLSVLWVIGWSMILLAGLIWLPRTALIVLTVIIIASHNLWPSIAPVSALEFVIATIHNTPFFIPAIGTVVTYTIIPWVGVMMAGYLIGQWFQHAESVRSKNLLTLGVGLLTLFFLLRLLNIYGDPVPHSVQERGWMFTLLSFINVTKYPPSLQFLCLTLGVGAILLSLRRNDNSSINRFLITYGRVPFFFFVLHFALISLSSYLWTWIEFGKGFNLAFADAASRPTDYEPGLLRVYIVWIAVIVATYFPCKWFGEYKRKNGAWWLGYL